MLYESLGFNNGYFGWKPNFAISQLPSVEINEKNQTFDYDAGFLYTDDVFVVVNDKLLSFSDWVGLFTA